MQFREKVLLGVSDKRKRDKLKLKHFGCSCAFSKFVISGPFKKCSSTTERVKHIASFFLREALQRQLSLRNNKNF